MSEKKTDSSTQLQSTEGDSNFLLLLAEHLRRQGESLLQSAFLLNSQAKSAIKLAEAIEEQLKEIEAESSPLVQISRERT